MTKDDLKTLLRTYMYDEDVAKVMSAVEEYSSALIATKPFVSGALPPTYAVNRVEVIDEAGRSYVNWHKKNCVEVQLQDESRTMKVFISRRQ